MRILHVWDHPSIMKQKVAHRLKLSDLAVRSIFAYRRVRRNTEPPGNIAGVPITIAD